MHPSSSPTPQVKNLRTPQVMERVQAEIEQVYQSTLVQHIRHATHHCYTVGQTTVYLAEEFGLCYGVERAIDLAYAARQVFLEQRIFILGEIIHNPEVNQRLAALGIQNLLGPQATISFADLTPQDVVIIPAFGCDRRILEGIQKIGCQVVDTTCGDVMKVWKRVRQNAQEGVTSLIHGKAGHEETQATASQALGPDGLGHYLILLNREEAERVCRFIRKSEDSQAFLQSFSGAYSPGFHPNTHLKRIGLANQTTMLRQETESIQRMLREAIQDRDGGSLENFRCFDTICGATQDRQDALVELLKRPIDLLLVIGGYNSSNTTHLAEIGQQHVPTYFICDAQCLHSRTQIACFDLEQHQEVIRKDWLSKNRLSDQLSDRLSQDNESAENTLSHNIGITAGASCPNHLIEAVIVRVMDLCGEVCRNEKGELAGVWS